MTEVFSAIIMLMVALFWVAVVLVGVGILIGIPAAILAFIFSKVSE